MALRNIVELGDDILRKKCRPVTDVRSERIQILIDDMIETLHEANGAGLAAPQVGVLRRLFVVEVENSGTLVLVNPEIVEADGLQEGEEGCLSLPGRAGKVERPNHVKIKGLDRNGEEVVYEGTGMLARAFCHENDHLDGILYVDKATDVWEYEAEKR